MKTEGTIKGGMRDKMMFLWQDRVANRTGLSGTENKMGQSYWDKEGKWTVLHFPNLWNQNELLTNFHCISSWQNWIHNNTSI